MFRYDAVLFDMDGTLLDSVDDIADALNQTLEEYGYPTHSRNDVAGFLGGGTMQLFRRALHEFTDEAEAERMVACYRKLYDRYRTRKTRPYPGVLPMLAALDEAGMKLAIISNKDGESVEQMAKAYFGSLIHIAVGAREGVPLKPEPDMLRLAMRELRAEPERTLYIGDAPSDFHAAQNAGADCILARWGYNDPETLEPLSPLCFADDPAELPMLILHEQEGLR